jgi:hypothetical protein
LSGREIEDTINLKIFIKEKLEVNDSKNNIINFDLNIQKLIHNKK